MPKPLFQYLKLITIFTVIVHFFACAGKPHHMCGFVDYVLATQSFMESILETQKLCFNLCLHHPYCESTNYILQTHRCSLNNVSHLDSSQKFMLVPGSFYAFSESLSDCCMAPVPEKEAVWIEQDLSLIGKTSHQSSTYHQPSVLRAASKAIDGIATAPCAHTQMESNPWWYVDLGAEHWVSQVTIVNRQDEYGNRLEGGRVRVGNSIVITNNKMCGSVVTMDEARSGDQLNFGCNPQILARYVSVDIGRKEYLTICEVMVKEHTQIRK